MSTVDYATVPEPETEAQVWDYFERSQQAKKAGRTRSRKAEIRRRVAAGQPAIEPGRMHGDHVDIYAAYGVSGAVVKPEHLADVAEARKHWEEARRRERAAQVILVESIKAARANGATMQEIAAELGTSRQYVNKLLKGKA